MRACNCQQIRPQARDTIAAFEAAGTTWLLDSAGGPDNLLARLRRGPPP